MWVEKNGPTFRIRDEVAGRKYDLATGYPSKTAALAAKKLLDADRVRGEELVPRGGRITLNAFLDDWWPHYARTLKATTVHSEEGRVRNHIRPILGDYALDELDSVVVQEWAAQIEKGVGPPVPTGSSRERKPLAPKTVHNCHGLLYVILDAAMGRRLIRMNPCGSTHLPARVHREMMFLTDPEIATLITALPEHWRPLVMLLVGTGLRWGEAIGLKVGRVDLKGQKPKLLVVQQLQEMSNTGELVFTSPKTAKSRRTVSFTGQIVVVLTPLVEDKGADEMVFLSPKGLMIRTRNFRRIWTRACKEAGLPGLRVHDLRHTHAAILISANRPLSAISRRLGHSSIAVTDALYGHLREEVDEGILVAIEEAMSQVRPEDLAAEIAEELGDDLDEEIDGDEII